MHSRRLVLVAGLSLHAAAFLHADTLMNVTLSGANIQSIATAERGTISADFFLTLDVIHWHAITGQQNGLAPAAPAPGSRAALIDGDLALNTGLINPGTANGDGPSGSLTLAQQALVGPTENTLNGMGIRFVGGLINGPGYDLVIFEYTDHSSTNVADGIVISRLDGVLGFLTVANGAAGNDRGGYHLESASPLPATSTATVASTNLEGVETATWTPANPVNQGWVAVGIDLSDLGYAPDAVVDSLFIADLAGAGNTDVTAIAALPIPEPATGMALLSGMAVFLARRRRI